MSRMIVLLTGLLLVNAAARGQERLLWIKLSEDRVIPTAKFQALVPDSLVILYGGTERSVCLEEIRQIRLIGESRILDGAIVGAGIGLTSGGVAALLLRSSFSRHAHPVAPVLIFGTLGAIIGSVSESIAGSSTVLDLSEKSSSEKREIIRTLLSRDPESVQ